jgi:hypothetical protein
MMVWIAIGFILQLDAQGVTCDIMPKEIIMKRNHCSTVAVAMLWSVAVFLGGFGVVGPAFSQAPVKKGGRASVTVEMGAKNIAIPAPNGFAEVSLLFPNSRLLRQKNIPGDQEIVAWFLWHGLIETKVDGRSDGFHRSATVRVLNEMKEEDLSPADFEEIRKTIKENQGEMVEGARKLLNQVMLENNLAGSRRMRTDMAPLGVLADEPDYLIYGMFLQIGGQRLAVLTAMVLVQGRGIFMDVTSPYISKGDTDWAEKICKEWIANLQKANAKK